MAKSTFLYINLVIALFFVLPVLQAKEKTFTVVIDAGHGGKDPGARGTVINEKAINLAVALKLGSLISEKHSDVKVIYTRKTDVFIELDERANIANRNKADLFISIHTNAVKRGSSVSGTETYTLGLARSDENLEVAMRENSAILLEDNYLQKYEGFDPKSSESYIIFEFMQNKHMEQSISLASEVQKCFTSAKRNNRGVRQAGFLVLRKTSMPSILVELGYISNPAEERFMKTKDGQDKLATAIYNAFTKYKWEYDRKRGALSGNTSAAPVLQVVDDQESVVTAPPGSEEYIRQKNKAEEVKTVRQSKSATPEAQMATQVKKGQTVYKIQILTSDKKLSPNSKLFKGYKNVDYFVEKGIYKYTYGETTNFDSIRKMRRQVAKDFKDAFIVAFKDGKKVKY
ncbi:N-acetylmuramoyl-L-alanine amidase [Parabacteroides acidifaciens]|uniref:N-acetylmuramoyl-L-alanine amidase n=1 Tax=Parabacteroides acidifaciens TaxID=2290935 RepID=A0A3D8HJ57_9BACT|nr:N-acetylmuramoyl-L-alanine amidase [Parabacteroides acidifaciens]MBC8600329.1 N-acetylmuramoyl-L-alanine amidase [Parabacteroides acidifaciens]RDU50961.1 N-acetylmuramoyl-L-alanine amidase [Parabacteroides acidifaciens]